MKIAVLDFGDPILSSLTASFKEMGHEVEHLAVKNLSAKNLMESLDKFCPNLCLSHNYYLFDAHQHGRELEEYFQRQKWPLILWYFEAPHASGSPEMMDRWNRGALMKEALYFNSDSFFTHEFKQKGLHAHHLPLAIDEKLGSIKSSPELEQKFQFPAAYVGNTLEWSREEFLGASNLKDFALNVFRAEIWTSLFIQLGGKEEHARLVESYDAACGPFLIRFFGKSYKNSQEYLQQVEFLLLQVSKVLPDSAMSHFRACRGRLDWIYSRYHDLEILESLLDLDFRLYGSPYWKIAFPKYSHDTRRLSDDELIAIYRGTKVLFCSTKFQFQHLVHDRPLAVLAVGGFPLTDERKDLSEMFKPDEIARYSSVEEAKDLIKFYSSHEPERQKVIAKGRERVLKEHTYKQRAKKILEISQKHFGL